MLQDSLEMTPRCGARPLAVAPASGGIPPQVIGGVEGGVGTPALIRVEQLATFVLHLESLADDSYDRRARGDASR